MFQRRSKTIKYLLDLIPGKTIYKTLPIFFFLGAGLEWVMIKWSPGGVNFYDVFNRNHARQVAYSRVMGDIYRKKAASEKPEN